MSGSGLVPEELHSAYQGSQIICKTTGLLEKIGVDLYILLPFLWNSRFFENSRHRAGRLARAAVDALIGIDIKLLAGFKILLGLSGMNAVHRADIDTRRVLHTHARLRNYIGHSLRYPPLGPPCESVLITRLHDGKVFVFLVVLAHFCHVQYSVLHTCCQSAFAAMLWQQAWDGVRPGLSASGLRLCVHNSLQAHAAGYPSLPAAVVGGTAFRRRPGPAQQTPGRSDRGSHKRRALRYCCSHLPPSPGSWPAGSRLSGCCAGTYTGDGQSA